jgi:hypothetical protein
MTAMQGAQRGESEADAALVPQRAGQPAAAGAGVLAIDELDGREIGDERGGGDRRDSPGLCVRAGISR